ncbi:MAG: hypothetical protein ACLRVT_05790 [Oscillospiraceae bacterium]
MAFGKMPVSVAKLVDHYALRAQNLCAQVWRLYVRRGVLGALFFGGEQQESCAPGTESAPLIAGLGLKPPVPSGDGPAHPGGAGVIPRLRQQLADIRGETPQRTACILLNFPAGVRSRPCHFGGAGNLCFQRLHRLKGCSAGAGIHEAAWGRIDSAIRVTSPQIHERISRP